jgi:hypothetical protein
VLIFFISLSELVVGVSDRSINIETAININPTIKPKAIDVMANAGKIIMMPMILSASNGDGVFLGIVHITFG